MSKKKQPDGALPYFKFFVTAWIGKAISDCDLTTQGLFTNLCAFYWLDKGKLSYQRMQLKFKRKQKHFDELIRLDILKVEGDQIVISFLDEQLYELGLVSEQNRKIAIEAWKQRKSDAPALPSHSDRTTNAIPIEEKRREETRVEETRVEETRVDTHAPVENFDLKIDSRETTAAVENHCKFFSVSTDVMSIRFSELVNFVETLSRRGQYQQLTKSFDAYKAYKSMAQEQLHGITKWMGTRDNFYRDGEWVMTDWAMKLDNLQRIGKIRNGSGNNSNASKEEVSAWQSQG